MSARRHASSSRCLGAGLLVVLALAGCGGAQAPGPSTSTLTRSSTTTQATTSTTSTTDTTGTTGTTTQPTLPGAGRPTVALGDMNTPEQFVLGELYAEALSAQGYSVTLSRNVGAIPVRQQALQQGSLDMYPEYLNVWNSSIAGDTRTFRTERAAYRAGQQYATSQHLELLAPTPASDVVGLAVTASSAERNDLRSLTDLGENAPSMVFGVPPEFAQSAQGLPLLEHSYGFEPASVSPIDDGEGYTELTDGTVQAAYVNSTDPELASGEFVLLSDPHHTLGFGNIVPVVTRKAIAAEGPSFVTTINAVSRLISTPVLRYLNGVLTAGTGPTVAAQDFLKDHGLLPTSSPG